MALLITDAGLAALVNAEKNGTLPVTISHLGYGSGQYTPTADQTALASPIKEVTALTGGAVSANVLHVTAEDNSSDAYSVFEVGVFLDDGTLFAVASQNNPFLQKAADSIALISVDISLADFSAANVVVSGDTSFFNPPATTETPGVIEIATAEEVQAGTDNTRAVTPATLQAAGLSDVVHKTGAETITGSKTFNALQVSDSAPYIRIGNSGVIKGTTPQAGQYWGISFSDSEGYVSRHRLGLIETIYNTAGEVSLSLGVYKPEHGNSSSMSKITLTYPAEGSPYATAPTPNNPDDNSTKIATTAWVKAKTDKYLPLAGGTMSGSINLGYQPLTGIQRLELNPPTDTANNGGFIDFHFNRSAEDYTARIIEDGEGVLSVLAPNGFKRNGKNITLEGDCLPVSGGAMTATKAITRDVNDSFLGLQGGTGENNDGAQLYLCGANHATNPSAFQLHARNSETDKILEGRIDGRLLWDDKYVLSNSFLMPTDSGAIMLTSGTTASGGAYFRLYGKSHSSGAGQFNLAATDGTNTKVLTGKPDGTLTWGGANVVRSVNGASANSNGDVSISIGAAHVTTFWVSSTGTQWYIKYSNGYCMQGGTYIVSTSLGYTITLPKPFVNTNYTAILIPLSETSANNTILYSPNFHATKSTTKMSGKLISYKNQTFDSARNIFIDFIAFGLSD